MDYFARIVSYVFLIGCQSVTSLPDNIRVGGLFETDRTVEARAFKDAIARLDQTRKILPKTLLVYDVQEVLSHDSFYASKKVCAQIEKGVAAIFGPMSAMSAAHVQTICDAMEIPHIQSRWDANDIRDFYSLNVYPHHYTLSMAYVSVVEKWEWTDFVILYEDIEGLIRVQELLKSSDRDRHITVRMLPANGDYYPLFKELKELRAFRFIVDCDVKRVERILKHALQIQMVDPYYHFMFMTLDMELVNLEDFKLTYANITAFRLIDPNNKQVEALMATWALSHYKGWPSPLVGLRMLPTDTALIIDAVHVFAEALKLVSAARDIDVMPLSCSKKQTWSHGSSLLSYMKIVELDGLSGKVRFDGNGLRTDFDLDLIELSSQGLRKIGKWNIKEGLNVTKTKKMVVEESTESLKNRTLIATTVIEPPYFMINPTPTGPDDLYIGFCVELLEKISEIANFTYRFRVRKDKTFGALQKDGTWNGMVRELMDRTADLAVAGMTITYNREREIDFTKPFLNLGITILYRKPAKEPPKLFSFLQPLSIEVWVFIIAAYLCVSFMLFVLARFSPYEWYNPHPCNPDSDIVENQFTVLNSLWFTIGSLMQQGSDLAPRALSTRLVSGIWWFFTLIMISSYTANLAAFLTFERMVSPITGADDLAKQTKIKYGTLWGGSTRMFFTRSEVPTYEAMWRFMSTTTPSCFVNSTDAGVQRVLNENYAYLAESTTVDYVVGKNCNLTQIGGWLDSKGYGIATPKGSPLRDRMSEAILKLKEDQVINKIYLKWWKRQGEPCPGDEEKKDASELDVNNVAGIFVVLLGGLGVAVVIVLIEFVWKARTNSRSDKQTLCSEMAEDFRFAIKCMGSDTKTLKKHRESNGDIKDNGLQAVPLTGYNTYTPTNMESYT